MSRLTTAIAWIALVVGIIALIVAWMAYNRTGEELEQTIRDEVQEIFQQNQQNPTNGGDEEDADQDADTPSEGVRIDVAN